MIKYKKSVVFKIFSVILLFSLLYGVSAQVTGAFISVDADYVTVYPGDEAKINVNVENNEDFDIKDISVSLDLSKVPFTPVGSSVKSGDKINDGDDEDFSFTIKASTDAKPGDYDLPYIVSYKNSDGDNFTKSGSFGIRISAKTELDFSVEAEDAIVGEQGKLSLKIVNKGLGDVKFISVQIEPNGFDLTSANKVYIGTISSDDSDTATFDVIYKSSNPTFSAMITFKDFDNNDQTRTINIPFKVYTREEALNLGLIKKNNSAIYAAIIVLVIILWFVYRKVKKNRREKRRKEKEGR